ncbi:MAG: thioredoxin domain-containing protein [Chloroflexota bacterium]|nr:MAG: thioredoxin domain-containing protein [Chloroflexota bacterium]
MSNQLTNSSSPYLLQHADNPVNWYPWGEEALQRAVKEGKPIFLSIGYAACHWCHVMAHESFEDPAIARIMNDSFINIKVDREERPDIDSIYMAAVVSLTGQGGWPLSVFLTPDQKPFFGGTYFPPVPRYNMPAFRDVLLGVAKAWDEQKDRLMDSGDKIVAHIQQSVSVPNQSRGLSDSTLDRAADLLLENYDWKHGGWGSAPKFPQPMTIEFLLRRATRGDQDSLKIATHALDSMAQGGMYDLIGGGFARYSTDNNWEVPHFEKMLYDNAQLASVYLHAYLITGTKLFQEVSEGILQFVSRELTHPDGGFYSSLDADSEGEEGKFYLWTEDEIRDVIDDPFKVEFLLAAYGFTKKGNFEGKTIPRRILSDQQLSEKFGLNEKEISTHLQGLSLQLLQMRNTKVRPATDDKVLLSWNALMNLAFSSFGRYSGDKQYADMATRNLNFLLSNMQKDNRLFRSWRSGVANQPAYLEDYAALILALLNHYHTDPNPRWYRQAVTLIDSMIEHFYDPGQGLFYDTPNDHEELLIRPLDLQDNATPSGNSLAAYALLLVSAYEGDGKLRDMAVSMFENLSIMVEKYPTGFGIWLCAMDLAQNPLREIALLGDLQDKCLTALTNILWSKYRPGVIAAISQYPPPPGSPALLENRKLLNGAPTAYVCENFICQQPINDALQFGDLLA